MTKDIQIELCKNQVLKGHLVCENIRPLFNWEFDVCSVSKYEMVYEFEVKISRSDFKADSKKNKHSHYSNFGTHTKLTPNYFSYVCPDGLISITEIPSYSGLYYFSDGILTEIKAPRRLHGVKHDINRILNKMLRMKCERQYLGMCRLTYENKKVTDYNNNLKTPRP